MLTDEETIETDPFVTNMPSSLSHILMEMNEAGKEGKHLPMLQEKTGQLGYSHVL